MKAAFDRLPLFIIGRLNGLIVDIMAEGESSVASAMPTGIEDGHTLSDLFKDIKNGGLAEYLNVDSTIVRLILIVAVLFAGGGLLAYLIAAMIMPSK